MQDHYQKAAAFIETAIRKIGGLNQASSIKVLDFGCGRGQLLTALLQLDFNAYGCDSSAFASSYQPVLSERLRMISSTPYHLPFDDNTFDVVVSTSVLEHVNNKEECLREIHRVLRPGGYSMHLYPGKWYLPYEPHLYVPIVNYLWPACPTWWLGLWALLGIRNEFQQNMSWEEVLESNHRYCQEGISYWSTSQYRTLSLKIFGNCSWPMEFYIENSFGGFARIARKLPFKKFLGIASREMRMGFMVHKKLI